MIKNILNIKMSFMAVILASLLALTFTSCKDNDAEGYGTPEITGVRVPDPEKADSLFTQAGQGTIIAILGNNLAHVMKVYVNDQEVSFNSTMNTDHSVIITIPTEVKGFKLTAFNSELKDEIRVETSHGTATYAFKIVAPGPQLQRTQGAYPREEGDTLHLFGLNLVDVKSIYLTTAMQAQLDTTVWTEVPGTHTAMKEYFDIVKDHKLNSSTQSYETTSEIGAIIPANAPDSGSVVVECAAGTTYLSYSKRPGKPVILGVSSDMPQIGETLILTGREFVQVESVKYGDVTLTSDQFQVSTSEDSIYINFDKKPTEGSGIELSVTTPGGTVVANTAFYDYSTLLCNFDDTETGHNGTDNGWDPKATLEDGGTADGNYERIYAETEYQQWWGTMMFFRKDWVDNIFPLSSNIPSTASAAEIYLAMEVYDNYSDYNQPQEEGRFNGYLRYCVWPIGLDGSDSSNQYDNFSWDKDLVSGADYDAGIGGNPDGPVLQDLNGKAHKGMWYRHVIPLSYFPCYAGLSYADIVKLGLSQFRVQSINQGTNPGKVDVRFDNVRVIYIPSK